MVFLRDEAELHVKYQVKIFYKKIQNCIQRSVLEI